MRDFSRERRARYFAKVLGFAVPICHAVNYALFLIMLHGTVLLIGTAVISPPPFPFATERAGRTTPHSRTLRAPNGGGIRDIFLSIKALDRAKTPECIGFILNAFAPLARSENLENPLTKANGPPALGLPPITDPRLVKAYSHPTRVKILSRLAVTPSTPRSLSNEIEEPINNVAYHFKVLKRLGCIELVKATAVRGGRVQEHLYRATRQPLMHLEAWEMLSEQEKHLWAETVMRLITKNIEESMRQGIFLDPDDGHMSRTPVTVDRQGWTEAIDVLDRAADEVFEIQSRVADRLEDGDESSFHAKIVMLQFRHQDPF